ncbi:hypothetical protein JHK85_023656 [Glycine max]|uniref:Uncharacterized protein n=2 Tax=Glycine subgen. Soja TaxID=1462606 RepID=A0A0R0IVA5_SOYBN|nr:hypothetical protein JHK87_023057 [Glycine soja]KAG5017520.1 hypothetical protein JHK85_023656 [Glycine max]KAG5027267.1 hypothetical protein JHK86_023181 [Glycine max]KAH1054078.1 hypothetical protein GYH30_023041 [Glycine max]RZB99783.1 hypothetical protein D0Y65_022261 [Glycine soja]
MNRSIINSKVYSKHVHTKNKIFKTEHSNNKIIHHSNTCLNIYSLIMLRNLYMFYHSLLFVYCSHVLIDCCYPNLAS